MKFVLFFVLLPYLLCSYSFTSPFRGGSRLSETVTGSITNSSPTCQNTNSTCGGSCGCYSNFPNTSCTVPLMVNYTAASITTPYNLVLLATTDCNIFWNVGSTSVTGDVTNGVAQYNSCLNTPNQKVCVRLCITSNTFTIGTGYSGRDVYKYCNQVIPDIGNQFGLCVNTNGVNTTSTVDFVCSNTVKNNGNQMEHFAETYNSIYSTFISASEKLCFEIIT